MNFDHYIAVDWSMTTMAVARLTGQAERLSEFEQEASVEELRVYLKSLKGTKILTIEESNSSQWLYVELHESVDKFFVCNPHRNRLLNDGPKSDQIDARKLVYLLKSNLMKEVFHSTDRVIYLRKLMSHYQDLVRMGVMNKNQRSALFRSYGLNHKKETFSGIDPIENFVLARLDRQIETYEEAKKEYENKFKELAKQLPQAKFLKSIPGIGDIHAIELLAILIDVKRFQSVGHLFSYAGLIRHERMSGGKYYGDRKPRYSRELKRVIKMIVYAALSRGADNKVSRYYNYLVGKGMPEHNARNACARKVLAYSYGVLKSERKLDRGNF